MSWRNFNNHRDETKAVKEALKRAGIPVRRVGHGTGTAWGWLDIYLKEGADWGKYHRFAIQVAQAVTGRTGEYDGCINVH